MASSSYALSSTDLKSTFSAPTLDPKPVIQEFLRSRSVEKLSNLIETLKTANWNALTGAELLNLVNRVKELNSSKRKADVDLDPEEIAIQINALVDLVFFNMTSTHAIEALSSLDDEEDQVEFLEELPLESRLWVIQSEFSSMADSLQDRVIYSLQKTIDDTGSDLFYKEENNSLRIEENSSKTMATALFTTSAIHPKLAFIKEALLQQISSKSEEQSLDFPLETLADHFNEVADVEYQQQILDRVEKFLLINNISRRFSEIRENLNLDGLALHSEVQSLAKHLNAICRLGEKFHPYAFNAIQSFKETLFNGDDDENFSDLIPLLLQFVILQEDEQNETQAMNIQEYQVSFWHKAPANLINPLLDIWLDNLTAENLQSVTNELLIVITLESINPEIKDHLRTRLNVE